MTGLKRSAPFQHEDWYLEPFYGKAVNIILDTLTGDVFTSRHYPVANQIVTEDLLQSIVDSTDHASWPSDFRFLHALRFCFVDQGPNDKVVFEQPTVAIDALVRGKTYLERRKVLEEHLPQLGVRVLPKREKLYLVPRFSESEGDTLWAALHLANQEFKEPLYAGIIEKRASAPYIFQMEGECTTAMSWLYHPFTDQL